MRTRLIVAFIVVALLAALASAWVANGCGSFRGTGLSACRCVNEGGLR
jgi:hypothetical protein